MSDINNIYFFSTLKEELYNDNIQLKMMLSNLQHYLRIKNSDNAIVKKVLSNYNYEKKNNVYNLLIKENEQQIININNVLNNLCEHDFEKDYIDTHPDEPSKCIEYCKICNIKKEE